MTYIFSLGRFTNSSLSYEVFTSHPLQHIVTVHWEEAGGDNSKAITIVRGDLCQQLKFWKKDHSF